MTEANETYELVPIVIKTRRESWKLSENRRQKAKYNAQFRIS